MKKYAKKVLAIVVLLVIMPFSIVNASNENITTDISTQNMYETKSVGELISYLSEFKNYEDVNLFCVMALYENADNGYSELFSDIIFDKNESIVVRKVLLEICIKKNIPLERNKLINVIFDANEDLSLRKFVLDYCCLQGKLFVPEIEKLIQKNESGLVYRAMKKLFLIAPEKSLAYAKQKMVMSPETRGNFDAQQAAIEIVADKLYRDSTQEERLEYIEYCDKLLSVLDDQKQCDLILSAISSVESKETFLYVLQSEKLSDWQRIAVLKNNQSVIDDLAHTDIKDEYKNLIFAAEKNTSDYDLSESVDDNVNRNSENSINIIQGSSILSDGGGGFGHAGLMHRNGFEANDGVDTVVHVHQSFDSILYDDEEEFLSGNDFLGYFKPKQALSEEDRVCVLLTAFSLYLRTEEINYSLLNLISFSDSNNNEIIDFDEIEGMRCDGFVEYCYEYSGIKVCYDETKPNKWNISIIDDETQDVHSWTKIIPKSQAYDHMTNMLGDINADGSVTSADAQLAQQVGVGSVTFSQYQEFVANVDGEEGITASDARLILRYSVGLETIFPADPSLSDLQYLTWKGVLG